MKTILFATDFSMNSLHAIRYGLKLFHGTGSKFILFHGYDDPSIGTNLEFDFVDHVKAQAISMLHHQVEELKRDSSEAGVKMEVMTKYGSLPNVLDEVIDENNVDLVILGSSGSSGPGVNVFGSSAYATMKSVSCPVLAVPLLASLHFPARIGLATQTVIPSDTAYLKPLFDLAGIQKSKVLGVHVCEKGEHSQSDQANADDRLPYLHVEAEDPVEGIELAIGKHELNMLAIVFHQRGIIEDLFHTSISKQIVRHIGVPTLALRGV